MLVPAPYISVAGSAFTITSSSVGADAIELLSRIVIITKTLVSLVSLEKK